MNHDKEMQVKRNVPPRSEFMSDAAHILAQAEESSPAGYRYERRRKRLRNALVVLSILLVGIVVAFLRLNRR